ncbi:MAG: DUF4976 domain-containing protein [Planctomycetota bacterium]|nr:MAG: DUF4976 domain-containing protein [Planctomycetota bacterium]REK43508.1 MAG: DUF4976 domain-containing protein [Planctomycetota bacterium]
MMFAEARSEVRRVGLALLTIVLLGGCSEPEPPFEPLIEHDGPNVLLITLDTTRADHLGCYGYQRPGNPRPISPHLDAIAARGTVFTNAFCTASITPVSHASILTGQNPYTHGLRVLHGLHEYRLPDEAETLGETLRSVGYETAAFVSAFPAGSRFGLAQGMATFDEDFLQDAESGIVTADGTVNTGQNQRRAGDTTDRALAWLDAHLETAEKTDEAGQGGAARPFFLWLHYFDPHDPALLPPREYLDARPIVAATRSEQLKQTYDLEIEYMDHHIGRVIEALKARDELDNTVVVVVSDHGEGLGDHNWWTHGILYQEQIRAVMIVAAPGQPAARTFEPLVRIIDIMPTVLELVGVDSTYIPPTEGVSLASVVAGAKSIDRPPSPQPDSSEPGLNESAEESREADAEAPPRLVAYFDAVNTLSAYGETFLRQRGRRDDMLFGICDGRWKYLHHFHHETESELYDLENDPGERKNLYGDPQQRRQAARLLKLLLERDLMPGKRRSEAMAAEDIERLRSLGYVK